MILKYNDIMNNITVDDNMKNRILSNITIVEKVDKPNHPKGRKKKSLIISFASCFVLIFICAATFMQNIKDISPNDFNTLNTNPIIEYDSLEALESELNIDITLPTSTFKARKIQYFVIQNKVAQIKLINDNTILTYRVAVSKTTDISGDYNNYTNIKEVTINKQPLTLKGYDNKYNLLLWNKDDFAHSIQINPSIEEELLLNIYKDISG